LGYTDCMNPIDQNINPEPQHYESNAIFWIDVDKIRPNPYQPRKDFDENRLKDLSDSIRQYGVLMPIVVTRQEHQKEDGGLMAVYELIAGERRWRASKMAGVPQVPAVIRASTHSDKEKLEMAIIENLQREDLNPMDRARAFEELHTQFSLSHQEIGKKVGKSREYVSNTIRLLRMPDDMQQALSEGKIAEGHTRPLLMLMDRPQEQQTLFREIMLKKMTVREAEKISRTIAFERRRKFVANPELEELEEKLTEKLGTRVHIEAKAVGGKVHIDYFSVQDVERLFDLISKSFNTQFKTQFDDELAAAPQPLEVMAPAEVAEVPIAPQEEELTAPVLTEEIKSPSPVEEIIQAREPEEVREAPHEEELPPSSIDDRSKEEKDEDLYSVSNFTI